MPASVAPFPLLTRLHLALYALVFAAVAGFAYTDENPTALILISPALFLAWFLIDAPPQTPKPDPDSRQLPRLNLFPAAAGISKFLFPPTFHGWLGKIADELNAYFDFRENGAPKALLNLIVLAAACYLWYEVATDYAHQSLIISLTHFILVLLACKFLERKTHRDIAQIIVLSLLTVVASAMYSSSGLFYTLILAVYFGLLFYIMMLINLSLELARAAHIPAAPIDMPRNGSLPLLRRDLRISAKQCFFLVLPIAVVVFLVVPRSRSANFTAPWSVGSIQTGFTETVQFGDYGQLSRSDTPVMTVWLTRVDAQNQPIRVTSEFNDLYFRGQVLDQYDSVGKSWVHSSVLPLDPEPFGDSSPHDTPNVVENFELETASGHTLFCIAPIYWPPGNQLSYQPRDMILYLGTESRPAKFRYSVEWRPNAQPQSEDPTIEPGFLHPAGAGSAAFHVSPEITTLAQGLAKSYLTADQTVAPDDARYVITLFENYLKSHYPYSLTFKQVDYSKDPTTDFIVNRRLTGGHCEYFASAMVMMCRAVGLNARVVVGYHGGEYNSVDNTLIVRQKDAHAWAEIYVKDQGWVTSDPSPINANPDSSFSFLGRWFSDIASVMQNLWLSIFVSFDNDSRHAVAAWFAKHLVTTDLESEGFWREFLRGFWGPISMLGLGVTYLWARRRWRKAPYLLPHGTGQASFGVSGARSQMAFRDSLLHLFERPDHFRRSDQTPLEFLRPHLSKLNSASHDALWIVATAYGIRFGHLQLDADLRSQIAVALRRVKTDLHTPG